MSRGQRGIVPRCLETVESFPGQATKSTSPPSTPKRRDSPSAPAALHPRRGSRAGRRPSRQAVAESPCPVNPGSWSGRPASSSWVDHNPREGGMMVCANVEGSDFAYNLQGRAGRPWRGKLHAPSIRMRRRVQKWAPCICRVGGVEIAGDGGSQLRLLESAGCFQQNAPSTRSR